MSPFISNTLFSLLRSGGGGGGAEAAAAVCRYAYCIYIRSHLSSRALRSQRRAASIGVMIVTRDTMHLCFSNHPFFGSIICIYFPSSFSNSFAARDARFASVAHHIWNKEENNGDANKHFKTKSKVFASHVSNRHRFLSSCSKWKTKEKSHLLHVRLRTYYISYRYTRMAIKYMRIIDLNIPQFPVN